MTIKLIVGLRNPGASYAQTRHNAGGWFAEQLANRYNLTFKPEKKLHCELAHLEIDDKTCKIILPLTFMNHSGMPIRAVAQFYRIKPEEILVAHDELDLPAGRIKLKTGGGHGGHNGLRDSIQQLGMNHFHRLRIGIGHPGHKELVLNYVLGKPSAPEREAIFNAIDRAVDEIPTILSGNLAKAMNQINVGD
ncbi:aminoacyl-tRNA hydrolase [Legionella impletisoli]|uniref:Peptidyl-tRNA hydrolase n=1 Tax=Legionella impletisoli TaxID=343510 RepID=A0A917JTL2_9GAMM|nr:aminoacyl-tRNA hydrolase [Legionella impletisoli]GGI85212.1 peptidyl-tRNA hydrolase [Legionella impletisoli]